MLIDSHAHLNFSDFGNDLEVVIATAINNGVEKIINIGTSLKDSEGALTLADKYDNLFATVGIHPNDAFDATVKSVDWDKFERLLAGAVAIGECGLDFSRSKDKDRQVALFEKQLEIACKVNLPVVLHIRDAQDELISNFGHKLEAMKGVFHCFSGDENYLNTILKLLPGFYISFAGNVTFKNADKLRELAKCVPLERLMIETDAPFLTPEPYRGKRNEPRNVKIVAEKLALVKGVSFEILGEATRENTKRLFKI